MNKDKNEKRPDLKDSSDIIEKIIENQQNIASALRKIIRKIEEDEIPILGKKIRMRILLKKSPLKIRELRK